MDRAVVLCSGGLNSAVLAAVAAQEYRLALLHVQVGHRTSERESECFSGLVSHFNPAEKMVTEMPHIAAIGGSARLDPAETIEPYTASRDRLASTAIPGLLASLIAAAYAWATRLDAARVFLGTSENLGPPASSTASIWSDYSREFAYFWNHLFAASSGDRNLSLETPLLDLSRSEIIRLGQRLRVPFEHTWSCLSSGDEACGQCLGCATRTRGFVDAGIPDPARVPAVAGAGS